MKWRVNYELRCAGDKKWGTHMEVQASSPVGAIAAAKARQNEQDRDEGRSLRGCFADATAEVVK